MSEVVGSKPGWKTTEFWMSFAAVVLGALGASGMLAIDSLWAKIVGGALSVLAALGYTASRTFLKAGEVKVGGEVAATAAIADARKVEAIAESEARIAEASVVDEDE